MEERVERTGEARLCLKRDCCRPFFPLQAGTQNEGLLELPAAKDVWGLKLKAVGKEIWMRGRWPCLPVCPPPALWYI